MKTKIAGKFIVLDGPDGCGKSSQTKLLLEWAQKQGAKAVSFRDPGTTAIGERIREILLNPEHEAMDVRSELLLYMAARAQLWQEKIKPALTDDKCVIMDRWVSSTCAYQGYAGQFGEENVIKLAQHCLERVWSDFTVILDVDLATANQRMADERDRMEQKGDEYHQKVRQGFLELAKRYDSIAVVDASKQIELVHQRVLEIIKAGLLK